MNEKDPLRTLLHEWEAPEPPGALEARIRAGYRAGRPTLWERLWSFRVSIPVPVLAAAVLLIVGGFWLLERRTAPSPNSAPVRPAAGGYMTRLEAVGFQPLPDGEIRVVRSGVEQ